MQAPGGESAGCADEVEQLLVASAGEFLAERHRTERIKLNAPSPMPFDPALWRAMGELGWLALLVPESLGGSQLGLTHAAALAERLGASLVPEPYIACGIVPALIGTLIPDTPARNAILDRLRAGGALVTLAWQEHAGQIDALSTHTNLDDEGRVWGAKIFVPHGDLAELVIVVAARDDGPALVTVRAGATGITARHQPSGDRSNRSALRFDGVEIDSLLAIRETAARAVTRAVDAATLACAAYQTGVANAILEQTLAYLRTRKQFDRPLGTFQTLQHRAADLYMLGQLSSASWRHAAALWDKQPDSTMARAAVSAAKARADQASLKISQAGVQIHGGLGFAEEAELGLALRMAVQHAAWLGGRRQHLRRFMQLRGEQA